MPKLDDATNNAILLQIEHAADAILAVYRSAEVEGLPSLKFEADSIYASILALTGPLAKDQVPSTDFDDVPF